MFDYLVDCFSGQSVSVVLATVLVAIAVGELLPYVPGKREPWEWQFERHYGAWSFRVGVMVLMLLVHNQSVVVSELKEVAIAKGIPPQALPIASSEIVKTEYRITTPAGTVISFTGDANGQPRVHSGKDGFGYAGGWTAGPHTGSGSGSGSRSF